MSSAQQKRSISDVDRPSLATLALNQKATEKWNEIKQLIMKTETARQAELETFSSIDRVHNKINKFPTVWGLKAGRKCRKLYLQALENGSEQLQSLKDVDIKVKELLTIMSNGGIVNNNSALAAGTSSSGNGQQLASQMDGIDGQRKKLKVDSKSGNEPSPKPHHPKNVAGKTAAPTAYTANKNNNNTSINNNSNSNSSTGVLPEGTLVAAEIQKEGSLVWILAVVIDHDAKTGMYECEDAETDRDSPDYRRRYKLAVGRIVSLPNPPPNLSVKKFPVGSTVLALYPDTSCFYKAVVVGHEDGNYVVKFEEDQDQSRSISPGFVVPHPKSSKPAVAKQ